MSFLMVINFNYFSLLREKEDREMEKALQLAPDRDGKKKGCCNWKDFQMSYYHLFMNYVIIEIVNL